VKIFAKIDAASQHKHDESTLQKQPTALRHTVTPWGKEHHFMVLQFRAGFGENSGMQSGAPGLKRRENRRKYSPRFLMNPSIHTALGPIAARTFNPLVAGLNPARPTTNISSTDQAFPLRRESLFCVRI
jgi:hypothetical protein